MSRITLFNLGLCSLATGAAAVCLVNGLYPLAIACGVLFAVGLVNIVAYPHGLGRAYRCGWRMGRQAMFVSMSEAMQRHMTVPEWIEAELERDGIDFIRLHVEVEED